MPLTCHKQVGHYICLLLCPLSIYYYSAGFQESKYKRVWGLIRDTGPKQTKEEKARVILVGLKSNNFCHITRRQFPTVGRKLAGDFLSKEGEGRNHFLCHQGVAPPALIAHLRLLGP